MGNHTIRRAGHRVLRLWRPMAGWTILTWVLIALPVAPISSYVLGLDLLRGSQAVVGNEALLAWGPTLPGVAWALLAGGFVLIAAVVRFAGIFHIVTDDMEDRPPGLAQTALDLAPRLPGLFRLCMATVAGAAVLAVPLVAGLAAIRATVLGEFDINYYLTERPREWTLALALAGGWILLIGLPALVLLGRSVLALPAYLDGHEPLTRAVRESWARTRGGATRVLRSLGLVIAVWILGRSALVAAFALAGSAGINALSSATASLYPIVLAVGAYLLGLLVLDATLSFLGFTLAATVLTQSYHEDTDLHRLAPTGPGLGTVSRRARRMLQAGLRPAVAVPVGLLVLAASAVASVVAIGRAPDPDTVLVIAHRAGPAPAPENTLAALERAIEAGADWAEIDVQRTADGAVVVTHDADLMRMAGDPRRIRTTPYGQLSGVVQRPDDGSPPAERRLATLTEFLERSEDRIGLLIELKYYGPDPGLADAVVRTVREAGMSSEVRVMSLDYPAVRDVRRLAPRIETGYVATASVGDLTGLPLSFLAVPRSRVTPRLLRDAGARGLEVLAWTVNEPAEMADLVERGVHGLITDRPALARRVVAQLADLPPVARLLLRFRDFWDDDPTPAAGLEPASEARP